jgi:hypothetical protein
LRFDFTCCQFAISESGKSSSVRHLLNLWHGFIYIILKKPLHIQFVLRPKNSYSLAFPTTIKISSPIFIATTINHTTTAAAIVNQ